MDLKEQRISDSLYLLSKNNYWDSLKIVYDILINDVFLFAKNKKQLKQHLIEDKNKDVVCLLYDFLNEKNVKNIDSIISEIRLLTIFFDNYSRETLKGNVNNYKIKVLTLNIIGLLKFLDKNSDGAKYYFGQIDSALINEIQNNVTEEIYESTNNYFEIWVVIKKVFDRDFWDDLCEFESQNTPCVFSEEEIFYLKKYKGIIDKNQFRLDTKNRIEIEDIWSSYLNFDEVYKKVFNQYYLSEMHRLLVAFWKADKSSGKYSKNIYKAEKEEAFHKNIYPYITKNNNYDLVLSEHISGRQRHDIVIYKSDTSMSAIIELKVNTLDCVEKDIQQLVIYLAEASDKPHVYMEEPNIGVLAIYSIGDEPLANIDLTISQNLFPKMIKHSNNFYSFISEEAGNKPILIALFNGKE